MLPRRILLATDGSESARPAEAAAADLVGLMGGGELVVATVVRPRSAPAERGAFALWPLSQEEYDEAERMVTEVAARVAGMIGEEGVTVRPLIIETRSQAEGIIEAAHEGGTCSLIVMGSRGHGGFGSLVMGSTSTQVLHGAHCPVLIVKHEG